MQLRNSSFANRSSSFPLETCQGRNDGDDTGEDVNHDDEDDNKSTKVTMIVVLRQTVKYLSRSQ